MINGEYRTQKGSIIKISGKHSGDVTIDFDWVEEGACPDCEVSFEPRDLREGYLVWNCDYCGGGKTRMTKIKGGGTRGELL